MKKALLILLSAAALILNIQVFAADADTEFYVTKQSVTVQSLSADDTLLVALYNNDVMTGVKTYRGIGQVTANYAEDMSEAYINSDEVKVFVWDTDTLKPSCNSISKVIAELPETLPPPTPVTDNQMYLTVGNRTLTATLVENSSTAALKELLAQGDITIDMHDYGNMEKVGALGATIPRNDEYINTEAGDLILYGSAFVIYYDTNSYNFTRLGKINDITQSELKEILGSGNVSVTLSLNKKTEEKATPKYIQLSWNGNKIIVRLNNSKTSESLLNQLPLTLEFSDYAGTEKVAYPPETLDTSDAPSGYDPSVGDLTLYAPWGDLAFFYKDFGYASGLVPLGKVEEGEELLTSLSGSVTVEQVTKIKLSFGNNELDAFMYDNPTANAFVDMLPITLPMLDLYSNEMCYRFPDALPYDDAPSKGYEIGDIIYWPPRHSFVIRYAQNGETFEQFIGYVPTGVEALKNIGNIDITYELAD